jgi:ribulose-phosphate 3-epimerase
MPPWWVEQGYLLQREGRAGVRGIWQSVPNKQLLADVSLWSADLVNLEDSIRRVDPYVDLYHIDVSDSHFTENLLFFPDLVAAIRATTRRPLHVHLMVEKPLHHIARFVQAGADIITVHLENGHQVKDCLLRIDQEDRSAGLAVRLETDLQLVLPFIDLVEMVLLMGTPLGTKGQSASPEIYPRLSAMKRMLTEKGLSEQVKVAADGGIRHEAVPRLREAGADIVVPGSLVFKSDDIAATFRWLRSLG